MYYIRERVTIEEVVQFLEEESDAAEKLLDFWENPKPGDQFIIKGQNKVRTLLYDSVDIEDQKFDGYYLFYDSGSGEIESALHDDCHPLFTITQMMEAITEIVDLQIQKVDKKWIVISQSKLYTGKNGEDLCSILWKATTAVIMTY